MQNKDFFSALDALDKEKKINKDLFVESLEAGIASAYKKERGEARYIEVQLTPARSTIRVFTYKLVVDEVEDPEKELTLEEAQAIRPSYKVGDRVIEEELSPKMFTRIAAQTAKQVIMQRINDACRTMAESEMTEKSGEIVTAIIRRIDSGNVYVEMSGTQMEGIMMPSDQIRGERYKVNDVIKVYVKAVRSSLHGNSQVVVSRGCVGFVKRLFEIEVPEIKSGLVEIKKIVREAGYRTKMAVYPDDPSLDCVGCCIGQRGMRINNIIQELAGEKIDIIHWCSEPSEFIARSLSPAKALMVQVNDEEKSAKAIVPDDKLSLAIGKAGQNVRLAAKLTDWKIDVKPYSAVSSMLDSALDE